MKRAFFATVLCNMKEYHSMKDRPIQNAIVPLQRNISPRAVFSLVQSIQVALKVVFIFADFTSSWKNVHDLLCLGHLCGFFLFGELDLGCGSHGL